MTVSDAVGATLRVPTWPRIAAAVNADGTGALTLHGIERACAAESVNALRAGMIARAVTVAARVGRPVRLDVTEGSQTLALAVRPEGYVQLVTTNGTIPSAEGLALEEGRCRICRRLQPVTSGTCVQCGVNDPLRVETTPAGPDVYGRSYLDDLPTQVMDDDQPPIVEEPATADSGRSEATAESDSATVLGAAEREIEDDAFETRQTVRSVSRESGSARSLTLTVVGHRSITVQAGITVGRSPDPVGSRVTVALPNPGRSLSRNHATIDIDDVGQIILTDLHSTNGTDLLTDPPQHLRGGEPTVVPDGATVQLGDVRLTITAQHAAPLTS